MTKKVLAGEETGSRLRALLTTSTFPLASQDGLPRFVLDLGEALARQIDVTTLAPHAPGAARRERVGSVDVRRFPYFWPLEQQRLAYGDGMISNLRSSVLAKVQSLPFVASQVTALGAIVRRQRVSVVNSHWMVPQGLSAAFLRAMGLDFAHVLTVHGGDLFLLERLAGGRAVVRFILANTDQVFVVGRHMGPRLTKLSGTPVNCDVQPMGAEPALFGSGEMDTAVSPFSGGYLLFVGRLVEKKGLEYLLRTLPEITRHHPELGLVIIGYGPLELAARRMTERLGIASSVFFAGAKPHKEVAAYLRGATVVVVPSIEDRRGETEGMPTVVTEAMAVGSRVVASSIAGIPDVIRHAENGWLCQPANLTALTNTILESLQDPKDSAVRHRARLTAERLFWPEVAARYYRVFERVCRERSNAQNSVSTGLRRLFRERVRGPRD